MNLQQVLGPVRSVVGKAVRRAGWTRVATLPHADDQAASPEPVEHVDVFDALPVSRQSRLGGTTEPIPDATPVNELSVVWPWDRSEADLGQLESATQAALLARFGSLDPADCHWYHEVPTATGSRMPGAWDLIGGERAYLGDIDLSGKRVFELGPATGHLTWWMEQQGADVVAFDAGMQSAIDLIPYGPTTDLDQHREAMQFIASVQRSWWWVHEEHNLSAKCVYGSIYDPPDDLGRFDITTLSAVLLHLQSPFHAMRNVAAFTDDAIVVTDLEPPRPWGDTEMRFNPVEGDESSWWTITPGAMQRMLSNVGFTDQTITRHMQWHRPGHVLDATPIAMSMYTIVARRPS
jgi:hypothetical protein